MTDTEKPLAILKELAAHLAYDAGVNGSKYTEQPRGVLSLSMGDGHLWRRVCDCIGTSAPELLINPIGLPPTVTVEKRGGVWMMAGEPLLSCAREITEAAMTALQLDPAEFRLRDKVVTAISGKVDAMLDAAGKNKP